MSSITTTFDSERDLSIHKFDGKLETDDITGKLKEYYAGDKITLNVIWVFNESDVSDITSSDLRRILFHTKKYAHSRSGGKTALVVSKDLGYGLARIFETFVDYEPFPFEVRSFRSMNEAKEWLNIK